MKRTSALLVALLISARPAIPATKTAFDHRPANVYKTIPVQQKDVADSARVNDGPYFFWMGNRAVVQSVCNDEKISKIIDAPDSVRIAYACGDAVKTLWIKPAPPGIDSDSFVHAEKICAISDIHGNLDQMLKLLKANGIIDSANRWAWGDGHLVIVGDVFDRGPQMTEALWFIYQLEREARTSGGRVHMLLGNHEIMVLRGDIRYVHKKYRDVSKKLRIKIPDLYGSDTELGRWLRSKNVVIKN